MFLKTSRSFANHALFAMICVELPRAGWSAMGLAWVPAWDGLGLSGLDMYGWAVLGPFGPVWAGLGWVKFGWAGSVWW